MWMVKLYTEIGQFYVILALKLKNSSMIFLKDYGTYYWGFERYTSNKVWLLVLFFEEHFGASK